MPNERAVAAAAEPHRPREPVREPGPPGAAGSAARDADLVRAAQAGDVASFGQLYERYFDKVYSYLSFKLGNAAEAEDLAEHVFLKALESLGGYRWTGVPFQAWLFRIAHNLLVDYLRRRSKRASEPLDEALPDRRPEADPEALLAEKLTRQGLIEAVERLTELQRQVIALKFAGGLSNAEVAAILGKTEGAVKALQHAALQALQRQFARRGGVP
jgi:RNA polymerase sigma-70 factor (ECF subfamily)